MSSVPRDVRVSRWRRGVPHPRQGVQWVSQEVPGTLPQGFSWHFDQKNWQTFSPKSAVWLFGRFLGGGFFFSTWHFAPKIGHLDRTTVQDRPPTCPWFEPWLSGGGGFQILFPNTSWMPQRTHSTTAQFRMSPQDFTPMPFCFLPVSFRPGDHHTGSQSHHDWKVWLLSASFDQHIPDFSKKKSTFRGRSSTSASLPPNF